jgi:DNA invertase Pin-like site-specific DNA recombinase
MIRIYYRVSTDKQDFEMQVHAIETLLNSRGLDSDSCVIYKDFGISGTTTQRPEYQRLLADILEGDTILVYEFSRLWRDMEEQSKITKMFLALGVQVSSVVDGDLRTMNDTLTIDIKGVINQFEARRLKQRTIEGIRAKQAKVAKQEDVWKGRGKDKQKRSNEGYLKRWEKQRDVKN